MRDLEEVKELAVAYKAAWEANRAIPSDAPAHVSNTAHEACRSAREALFLATARREEVDTGANDS